MKGDESPAVECPLCGIRLHTRIWHSNAHGTRSTRTVIRYTIYRHLAWTHPETSTRDKSLICDEVNRQVVVQLGGVWSEG